MTAATRVPSGRVTLLSVASVLLLACTSSKPASEQEVRHSREKTAALIASADTVEVTLVEMKMHSAFRGEEVVRAPPRVLGPKDAALLRTVVAGLLASNDDLGSKCTFHPDLRVRFTRAGRSAEGVFCFSCKDAVLLGEGGEATPVKKTGFRSDAERLKALVDRVFADLPEERRALGKRPELPPRQQQVAY